MGAGGQHVLPGDKALWGQVIIRGQGSRQRGRGCGEAQFRVDVAYALCGGPEAIGSVYQGWRLCGLWESFSVMLQEAMAWQ